MKLAKWLFLAFFSVSIFIAIPVYCKLKNILHPPNYFDTGSSIPNNNKYVPGEVIIGFKKETSYQDAINLVKSENLTYEILSGSFEPTIFVSISPEQKETITGKLKDNKLISRFTTDHPLGEMSIEFIRGISVAEAEAIVTQADLTIKRHGYLSDVLVNTLKGKEQFYINKFKALPEVEYATLNHVLNMD